MVFLFWILLFDETIMAKSVMAINYITMTRDEKLGRVITALVHVPECRLDLIRDLAIRLAGINGDKLEIEIKDCLAEEFGLNNNQVTQEEGSKSTSSILELVSTFIVPATYSKFIANDKFVVNTERNAPVRISAVWGNFTSLFLFGEGKIEDPISEQTLRYHKLRKTSVASSIITELGGEAKAITTLTEVFSLMKNQRDGEDGVLLNNGRANVFNVLDNTNILSMVSARWRGDGWSVDARSIGSSHKLNNGCRVFTRVTS